MKHILSLLILASATLLVAQNPPPAAPPAMTDKQAAKFFKAAFENLKAQNEATKANQTAQLKVAALEAAIADLNKFCGDNFTAQFNQDGDPVCVANPDVKKEAKN